MGKESKCWISMRHVCQEQDYLMHKMMCTHLIGNLTVTSATLTLDPITNLHTKMPQSLPRHGRLGSLGRRLLDLALFIGTRRLRRIVVCHVELMIMQIAGRVVVIILLWRGRVRRYK